MCRYPTLKEFDDMFSGFETDRQRRTELL